MAAYKKVTWNKHWNSFKLTNEDELNTYLTPSGLWRGFTTDVHTCIVHQVENAEQKFISSLSKTTVTTKASSRSKPNSPSISLNCNFDCSFCSSHFPISPSKELLRLHEVLDATRKATLSYQLLLSIAPDIKLRLLTRTNPMIVNGLCKSILLLLGVTLRVYDLSWSILLPIHPTTNSTGP